MSDHDFTITSIPATRLATRGVTVESLDAIGDAISPAYADLAQALSRAALPLDGPAVAFYRFPADGVVEVHAGFPVSGTVKSDTDFEVVELPALDDVATVTHRGAMDTIGDTWQALGHWIEERGHTPSGEAAREVYRVMPMDDPSSWLTELQWPLRTS